MCRSRDRAAEWRRHWTLLIPSIAGSCSAPCMATLRGDDHPAREEFGWSRAEISAGRSSFRSLPCSSRRWSASASTASGPSDRLFGVLFFSPRAFTRPPVQHPVMVGVWAYWGWATCSPAHGLTTAINSVFDKNRGMAWRLH